MGKKTGDVVLVDNKSAFTVELESIIERTMGSSPTVIRFPETQIGRPRLIIFSGRASADKQLNAWSFRLLKMSEEAPSIGICYGAEALNLYRGGSLIRLPAMLSGIRPVNFIRGNPLGLTGELQVYESRHYGIKRLGRGLRVIATGSGIEGFIDESGRKMGLMFHPEKSGDDGDTIITSFLLFSQKL